MDLRNKSVSARLYKLMFAEADRIGLDWRAIGASLEIDEAAIAASDARVTGDKHVRMLKLAAQCLDAHEPMEDMSRCLLPFPNSPAWCSIARRCGRRCFDLSNIAI